MKIKIRATALLFIVLLLPWPVLAGLQVPWSLSYSDGSANNYQVKQDTKEGEVYFEYIPVRPEQSSTGMYSGGDPRKGLLDKKQTAELENWLDKLEKETSLRAKDRIKGSGSFRIKSGSETRSFLINDNPQLREFNDFVKKLP